MIGEPSPHDYPSDVELGLEPVRYCEVCGGQFTLERPALDVLGEGAFHVHCWCESRDVDLAEFVGPGGGSV